MGEKKLYLYLRDEEYGRKLQKYITSRHHPELRVEMMTEREIFWESRAYSNENDKENWLTDDKERMAYDRGDKSSLILLDERSDIDARKISYLQRSKGIYTELLTVLKLSELRSPDNSENCPAPGVYGVFSPDNKADILAPLLSQEFGQYGKTLYLSLSEFPVFYEQKDEDSEDAHSTSLGELIFKLGSKEFKEEVDRIAVKYGNCRRLPGVAHYRDLTDIRDDMSRFVERLAGECELDYIVICIDHVCDLFALSEKIKIIYVSDKSKTDKTQGEIFVNYAKVEHKESVIEEADFVTVEDDFVLLKNKMEKLLPESWLNDPGIKNCTEGMWNSDQSS